MDSPKPLLRPSGISAACLPVLILLVATCRQSCESEDTSAPGGGKARAPLTSGPHPVIKVVDGDTIWVRTVEGKRKVRFLNIDTPETRGEHRHPLGFDAEDFTRKLLEGCSVYLQKDPDQDDVDKYGRILRYVITEKGLNANIEIVRQGWSAYYTKYGPSGLYHVDFTSAEREARKGGIGIWMDHVFLSGGYLDNARGK